MLAPASVEAACGAIPDGGWLARYAGRHADTIVLGRLIATDFDGGHRYEVLSVYRGHAPPALPAAVRDVGSCTRQAVEPGERFIYVSGDRKRFGPMELIFPRVPGRGFVISHWGGEYQSLDDILGLLGVLPDTSTSPGVDSASASAPPAWAPVVVALLGFGLMLIRPLRPAGYPEG